jgi:hypothetical protein
MVPKRKDHRAAGRKGGFKSLGSNLPANAYKGKRMNDLHNMSDARAVEKIKAGLIHNSKVKRAYERTLKREEKSGFLAPSLDSFQKSPNSENVDSLP